MSVRAGFGRSPAALGTPAASGGFTLVSAIFLMVVLVVLGASIVTLSSVQHASTAQLLQAVRAHYAARAGIEWAGNQLVTCAGASPVSLTPGGALTGFTVNVTCTTAGTHTAGADVVNYYVVNVTATSGTYGGPDYVRRSAQAKLRTP